MAAIHRSVDLLLDPLRHSGASALAEAAEARIQFAEEDEFTSEGEDRDPLAPRTGETSRERGFRQLQIVDLVVSGILNQELLLQERNAELVREIRERAGDAPETPVVQTVTVIRASGELPRFETDLLSERRMRAIADLLVAWQRGVDETRRRLETDGY